MRIMEFLINYFVMLVQESKVYPQTKNGHFSLQGLFLVI
jgi:hypothetical protein